MKEKVIIYDRNKNVIYEGIMASSDWDFPCLFDKLTKEQIEKLADTLLYYINTHYSYYFDEPLDGFEDEEDIIDFLCDYYCDFSDDTDCFIQTEPIIEPVTRPAGLTVRQFYDLAKKNGALDATIKINYQCDDSWYDIKDRVITEDDIGTDFNGDISIDL